MVKLVVIGLVVLLFARTGPGRVDCSRFGVWYPAPRWARVLLGSVDGAIDPYNLYVQVVALVWDLCISASIVTGSQPGPPLRQMLAGIALFSLVAGVVGLVAVTVG